MQIGDKFVCRRVRELEIEISGTEEQTEIVGELPGFGGVFLEEVVGGRFDFG